MTIEELVRTHKHRASRAMFNQAITLAKTYDSMHHRNELDPPDLLLTYCNDAESHLDELQKVLRKFQFEHGYAGSSCNETLDFHLRELDHLRVRGLQRVLAEIDAVEAAQQAAQQASAAVVDFPQQSFADKNESFGPAEPRATFVQLRKPAAPRPTLKH